MSKKKFKQTTDGRTTAIKKSRAEELAGKRNFDTFTDEEKDLFLNDYLIPGEQRNSFSQIPGAHVGSLDEFYDSTSEALIKVSDIPNLARIRAANQSTFSQLNLGVGNAITNAGFDLIEGIGSIAALVGESFEESNERDYENAITRFAQSQRDLFGEIYTENPNEVFDMADPAWWIKGISDTAASVGGFAAGGAGLAKGFGAAGKFVAKGVKAVNASTKVANTAAKLGVKPLVYRTLNGTTKALENTVPKLATSAGLGYAESARSAAQVYDEVYAKAFEELGDEQKAKDIASSSANITALIGTAMLTATNFVPAAGFFASKKAASRGASKILQRKELSNKRTGLRRTKKADRIYEDTPSYQKRIDELNLSSKEIAKKGKNRITNSVLFEMASESGEELLSDIAQKYGVQEGMEDIERSDGVPDLSYHNLDIMDSAYDSITSEEGLSAMFWGALMGGGMKGARERMTWNKTYDYDEKGNIKYTEDAEGIKTAEKSWKTPHKRAIIEAEANYAKNRNNIIHDLERVQSLQKDLATAAQNGKTGDGRTYEEVQEDLIDISKYRSSVEGFQDNIIQDFKIGQKLDNKKFLTDDIAEELKSVNKDIATLKEAAATGEGLTEEENSILSSMEQQKAQLIQDLNKYEGKTEAMASGYAQRRDTDTYADPYKEKLGKLIEQFEEAAVSHSILKDTYNSEDDLVYGVADHLFDTLLQSKKYGRLRDATKEKLGKVDDDLVGNPVIHDMVEDKVNRTINNFIDNLIKGTDSKVYKDILKASKKPLKEEVVDITSLLEGIENDTDRNKIIRKFDTVAKAYSDIAVGFDNMKESENSIEALNKEVDRLFKKKNKNPEEVRKYTILKDAQSSYNKVVNIYTKGLEGLKKEFKEFNIPTNTLETILRNLDSYAKDIETLNKNEDYINNSINAEMYDVSQKYFDKIYDTISSKKGRKEFISNKKKREESLDVIGKQMGLKKENKGIVNKAKSKISGIKERLSNAKNKIVDKVKTRDTTKTLPKDPIKPKNQDKKANKDLDRKEETTVNPINDTSDVITTPQYDALLSFLSNPQLVEHIERMKSIPNLGELYVFVDKTLKGILNSAEAKSMDPVQFASLQAMVPHLVGVFSGDITNVEEVGQALTEGPSKLDIAVNNINSSLGTDFNTYSEDSNMDLNSVAIETAIKFNKQGTTEETGDTIAYEAVIDSISGLVQREGFISLDLEAEHAKTVGKVVDIYQGNQGWDNFIGKKGRSLSELNGVVEHVNAFFQGKADVNNKKLDFSTFEVVEAEGDVLALVRRDEKYMKDQGKRYVDKITIKKKKTLGAKRVSGVALAATSNEFDRNTQKQLRNVTEGKDFESLNLMNDPEEVFTLEYDFDYDGEIYTYDEGLVVTRVNWKEEKGKRDNNWIINNVPIKVMKGDELKGYVPSLESTNADTIAHETESNANNVEIQRRNVSNLRESLYESAGRAFDGNITITASTPSKGTGHLNLDIDSKMRPLSDLLTENTPEGFSFGIVEEGILIASDGNRSRIDGLTKERKADIEGKLSMVLKAPNGMRVEELFPFPRFNEVFGADGINTLLSLLFDSFTTNRVETDIDRFSPMELLKNVLLTTTQVTSDIGFSEINIPNRHTLISISESNRIVTAFRLGNQSFDATLRMGKEGLVLSYKKGALEKDVTEIEIIEELLKRELKNASINISKKGILANSLPIVIDKVEGKYIVDKRSYTDFLMDNVKTSIVPKKIRSKAVDNLPEGSPNVKEDSDGKYESTWFNNSVVELDYTTVIEEKHNEFNEKKKYEEDGDDVELAELNDIDLDINLDSVGIDVKVMEQETNYKINC